VIYPGPGGNKGEYLVAESTNTKRRTDGTIVWSRPSREFGGWNWGRFTNFDSRGLND